MFSIRLAEILHYHNVQPKELAAISGIGYPTISKFVSGERLPNVDHLKKISKALKIPPGIFYWDNEVPIEEALSNGSMDVVPFRGGFIFPIYYSKEHKILLFIMVFTKDIKIEWSSMKVDDIRLMKDELNTTIQLRSGRAVIHFFRGKHIMSNGDFYILKGYETHIDIDRGTEIMVVGSIKNTEHMEKYVHIVAKEIERISTNCNMLNKYHPAGF